MTPALILWLRTHHYPEGCISCCAVAQWIFTLTNFAARGSRSQKSPLTVGSMSKEVASQWHAACSHALAALCQPVSSQPHSIARQPGSMPVRFSEGGGASAGPSGLSTASSAPPASYAEVMSQSRSTGSIASLPARVSSQQQPATLAAVYAQRPDADGFAEIELSSSPVTKASGRRSEAEMAPSSTKGNGQATAARLSNGLSAKLSRADIAAELARQDSDIAPDGGCCTHAFGRLLVCCGHRQ